MRRTKNPLTSQVVAHASKDRVPVEPYEGSNSVVSTGSTLLDLAISGGRFERGGIPGGILVEVFGPSSSGKTVLLCEIAGAVQRQGGRVMFKDPEARLNKRFARLFDLEVDEVDYETPDTVPEVFEPIRKWNPKPNDGTVHGVFADSLAALTTEMEMEDQDKMGMRRAKEFSEQCRLTCRILAEDNLLMVCSNQVRQNLDAGPYGQKYTTPGGVSIGFYSSLRLRFSSPRKIKKKKTLSGKEHTRVIGVETDVEVFKSTVWEPYRIAPIYILFQYGIDDIRANLQWLKTNTSSKVYMVGETRISNSLDESIEIVEQDGLVDALKQEVVELWQDIERKFRTKRMKKVR